MFPNKIPILHVVDIHTNFSSAEILKRQSIEGIWYAFLKCWASVYIGYPNKMRVDAGSAFTCPRWKQITDITGISVHISGVESHKSISKGEKYHDPLRKIFLKNKSEFSKIDNDTILKLTVKAMNDTMGPTGLVPSLLVFGMLPRFPAVQTNLPNQCDGMHALLMAKTEMEGIVAEQRLKTALSNNVPLASKTEYKSGDKVLVFREKAKPFKWTGPHEIKKFEGKQVFINRNGEELKHSIHQIKPYVEEPTEEILLNINHILQTLFIKTEKEEEDILITKVIPFKDPKNQLPIFYEAKFKELDGLKKRKVWEICNRKDVPHGANIITGRFVCTIKNIGTPEERQKLGS